MSEEALITVETFRFLPEAEAVRMFLEAEGLTVFLADAETVNMDWLLGNAVGNIKMQVPAEQAEKAMEFLQGWNERRAARAEELQDQEDEDEGQPENTTCLACGTAMPEEVSQCPACGWSYGGESSAPVE